MIRLLITVIFALAIAITSHSCENSDDNTRPDISTSGLGKTCPASGCEDGQDCITASGPGGYTYTCEIKCDGNQDCPEKWKCNIPPVLPDSIPNVCIED